MLVHKAYKVRLYPNKTQEAEMLRILAACRFVWNYFLALRKNHYLEHKKTLSYAQMSRQLTVLRKTTPELAGVQLLPLAQELRRLDKAYNTFFRKQNQFPKFKNEHRNKQSFEKPKDWRLLDGKVKAQKDLVLSVRGLLPQDVAKVGILTISLCAGKWFASIAVQEDITLPQKNGNPIGIDLGLSSLATTNEGKKYELQKHGLDNKLAHLQRKLWRQEIGSKRRAETRKQIARLYHRITNKRSDTLHKTTDAILKNSPSLVAVETLGVSNMMKNHNLARSIAHASWGEMLRQIRYKAEWRGGKVVAIDRFYPSSKTCSECFYVLDVLPLSKREWDCPGCGTHHDRDINAAKVILHQGRGTASVEGRKRTPVKRNARMSMSKN